MFCPSFFIPGEQSKMSDRITVGILGQGPEKIADETIKHERDITDILKDILNDILSGDNSVDIISGMSLGSEQIAAELTLKAKKKYPELRLIAAIPFEGRDSIWSTKASFRYQRLLRDSDEVRCISKGGFDIAKIYARNKFVVDKSDCLISVWNGDEGGIAKSIQMAKDKGIPVIIINPETLEKEEC